MTDISRLIIDALTYKLEFDKKQFRDKKLEEDYRQRFLQKLLKKQRIKND